MSFDKQAADQKVQENLKKSEENPEAVVVVEQKTSRQTEAQQSIKEINALLVHANEILKPSDQNKQKNKEEPVQQKPP